MGLVALEALAIGELSDSGAGLAAAADDRLFDLDAAYQAHYRSVYRYLLGLTRSVDESEEVAAEAFARALHAWVRRPPAPGTELPWLLLTARRTWIDRWRRARRAVRLRLSRPPAASDEHARTEFWLWFDALSAVLSSRQREVLLLRYQRDLSDEDIGQVMGLTPSGVRSLVARALDVLRAHPELIE